MQRPFVPLVQLESVVHMLRPPVCVQLPAIGFVWHCESPVRWLIGTPPSPPLLEEPLDEPLEEPLDEPLEDPLVEPLVELPPELLLDPPPELPELDPSAPASRPAPLKVLPPHAQSAA